MYLTRGSVLLSLTS